MSVCAAILLSGGLGIGYAVGSGRNSSSTGNQSAREVSLAAAAQRAKLNSHNGSDVMFARMMVTHHQQAIDMAELAATAAESGSVKDLAARIKAAQQPEIDKMHAWLTDWGAVSNEMAGMDHHSMGSAMSETDVAKLHELSGAAFDKAFLTMMIEHHDGAIEMAKDELNKGQDPNALALAASIQVTQQAEVAHMKFLLK